MELIRSLTTTAARLGIGAFLVVLFLCIAGDSASAQSGGAVSPSTPASTPSATPPPTVTTAGTEPPSRSTRLLEARARPGNAYYFGLKPARFAVTLGGKKPTDIRIDIRARGLGLLRSIQQNDVVPGVPQAIPWDGLTAAGAAAQGSLKFFVVGTNGERIAPAKEFKGKTSFGAYDHIFPVRGKHTYGDGLGAGRGHQGQDLAAGCGTKLVAARGGTVQTSAYQDGGAGYYVVIDGVDNDYDYVYMHLQGPPLVAVGDAVKTGQPIGQIGNTGRSSGCHLHFEMWGAPGWFEGGAVMDTAPMLRAWDAYS